MYEGGHWHLYVADFPPIAFTYANLNLGNGLMYTDCFAGVQALRTKAVASTVLKFDRESLLGGLAEAVKADPSLATQLQNAVKLSASAQ